MSQSLPYSTKDVHYDNAKFRPRSFFKDPDEEKWNTRQGNVKDPFVHAWSGYTKFAMGHDELMPVSQQGVDGLRGLGATVVDALDTAMIMDLENVVSEAGSWIDSKGK